MPAWQPTPPGGKPPSPSTTSAGSLSPEFCRLHGLRLHAFRRRLYARRVADLAVVLSRESPRFLPVTLIADPHPDSGPSTADRWC
jgi:hypothetical protein